MSGRGLIRIVEATIAILLIAGVLIFVFVDSQSADREDISELVQDIVDEMAENSNLRDKILSNDFTVCGGDSEIDEDIDGFVAERALTYNYEVRICEVGSVCGKCEFFEGDVYSRERIISSNLGTLNPRKVKVFIWQ